MKKNGKKIGIVILVIIIIALAIGLGLAMQKAKAAEEKVNNIALNEETSDDIVILFTNDVHCGIEENIGYSGLVAYKEMMEEQTEYVTLVDCGDAIQGDFIGLTSEGEYIVDIMNQAGYDFAILGNHEFDYGAEQLGDLIEKSEAQYLGCNIAYTGSGESAVENVKPYEIAQYGDTSVAYIGVTTPYTISSFTPANFMEDGRYVYDFAIDENGETLYNCVQTYVNECRNAGADYVVLLTHLGDGEEYTPFSVEELVNATEGVDAVLDGHAHSVIPCMVEENINGEEVLIASTGTKLANIGQLIITEDGTLTTGIISAYTQKNAQMESFIDEIQVTYEADLEKVVGTSDVKLSTTGEDGVYLVRSRETNIGDFIADAYRTVLGADIGLINGGGIRADLEAGDVTYGDLFTVHPFGNEICMVEATGQEILDCLEMVYRLVEADPNQGQDGGFQQVSGLKFTIDTSVVPSVTVDENQMFVSVDGERRVKDVQILNNEGEYEPLDVEATYTLATHDYMIKEGGSGVNLFMDNELIVDGGIADYQVLIDYITEHLGGKIDNRYAQAEGRITVK